MEGIGGGRGRGGDEEVDGMIMMKRRGDRKGRSLRGSSSFSGESSSILPSMSVAHSISFRAYSSQSSKRSIYFSSKNERRQ